jgi:hypothetical protein
MKSIFQCRIEKEEGSGVHARIFETETLITYNVIGILVTYMGVSHVWV